MGNLGIRNSGSGFFHLAQVVFRHGAHIAHDMGGIRAIGIMARQAHFRGDARQGGGVGGDARHIVPGDAVAHRDRHEGGGAPHLLDHAVDRLPVERQDCRQPGQRLLGLACGFAHDDDPVDRFVDGQGHTAAVEDQAPCRRDQAHVDAVFLGQQAELVGLIDLELLHPPADHTRHAKLHGPQQGCTARHPARDVEGFGCLGGAGASGRSLAAEPVHRRCPRLSTSPCAGRCRPKAICARPAISG